jgi:hypothetical protein
MPARQQNFANHTRYLPFYHYFVLPVLAANAFIKLWALTTSFSASAVWNAIVAIAIALIGFAARVMALTVQDRLIRLEETIRLQRVLPAELRDVIPRLRRGQFVALRFAPDAELTDLVRRVQSGELSDSKAIKRAIQSWRPDELRA